MERRVAGPPAVSEPATRAADMPPSERNRIRHSMERVIAQAYGLTYDAVVGSFEPYQALLREIVGFVERSHDSRDRATVKVLDVACGTGTVAIALARCGYSVVGLDVVGSLVGVARDRGAGAGAGRMEFHRLDVASDPIPGAGTYDLLVSMHTLYWHPDPRGLLEGCRRALRPGGHAVFLTYSRPARVAGTFRQIRVSQGWAPALRSLRWLVPTALFERFRDYEPHYMSAEQFHEALRAAGFRVLEARSTFLADLSLIAWVRADDGARPTS